METASWALRPRLWLQRKLVSLVFCVRLCLDTLCAIGMDLTCDF
jgi:hypothetical protein